MSEAGAASAADDGGQNTLANVTHHAERLVEELRLLAVITHQFEPASQEMLNSKMCVRCTPSRTFFMCLFMRFFTG